MNALPTLAATSTEIAKHIDATGFTKTALGLALVDNTSDLSKPISTLTQTALAGKQNNLTGLTAAGAQQLLLGNNIKCIKAGSNVTLSSDTTS